MLSYISYLVLLILLSCLPHTLSSSDDSLETYIIQVKPHKTTKTHEIYHRSFLPTETSSDRLLHSYTNIFHGFSAKLTKKELAHLSRKEGFVCAYPDITYPLHTTHTPEFLNLPSANVWKSSKFGKGVIIGVLDTGILPSHSSFHDSGVPSPPKRWRGQCHFFHNRGCNRKVIGAVSFDGSSDPTDYVGHGSHTASIIAGNFVKEAQGLFELANGTMSGVAPLAHLSVYKVCNHYGCSAANVLAGFDAAVKDRVDVLSLSFGRSSKSFFTDPIDLGALSAIQKGITVVSSAGNEGPKPGSISNDAPWLLTVAASSTDRALRTIVNLNNGKFYNGESKYIPADTTLNNKPYQLVYRGDCSYKFEDVEGKIVVCDYDTEVEPDVLATDLGGSGGAGLVMINSKENAYTTNARHLILPNSIISHEDGAAVKKYIESTANAVGSLVFVGSIVMNTTELEVAAFSSRGPSRKSAGILKPDVSAPGVNILAAWHTKIDPVSKVPVNVVSGTSMAAAHVSGIAALLKSVHPRWSASAIKSAIMTSSGLNHMINEQHKNASVFECGAGHVNPSNAMEPGLVYEAGVGDYVAYVCGLYGPHSVRRIDCKDVKEIPEWDLNYPSISVPAMNKEVIIRRTVTNVGKAKSAYKAVVDMPEKFKVRVEPKVLKFKKVNEKKTFRVKVMANGYGEGNLKWVSKDTVVRSPIVIGEPTP